MRDVFIVLSIILAILAPIAGLIMWIYGKKTNKKTLSHQGFLMLMISVLFFAMMVFSLAASYFYMWLMRN